MRIRIRNIPSKHDDDVPRTREKKDSVNGMPVDKVMLSLCTQMAVGSTGVWSIDTVPFDTCLQGRNTLSRGKPESPLRNRQAMAGIRMAGAESRPAPRNGSRAWPLQWLMLQKTANMFSPSVMGTMSSPAL